MKQRILYGTDILLGYLTNTDYAEGVAVVSQWIKQIEARKVIDKGTISILTHFVKTVELSRLRDFDVIEDMPKMMPALKAMASLMPVQMSDIRSLLMQLNLLETGYAEVLITENVLTHNLARQRAIDDKVFTIDEFVERCVADHRELDLARGVVLQEVPFGTLSLDDAFFTSFKEEYAPYYYEWFKKKRHDPVYVAKDKNGCLQALLKLKVETEDEDYSNIWPRFMPARRLKISALKVEYTGQKLGERFLRIIFDEAIRSHVGEIYVTIFSSSRLRKRLIAMLMKWGFEKWGFKDGNEDVYCRSMQKATMPVAMECYPFQSRKARFFLVGVGGTFADILIPATNLRKDRIDYEPYKNAIRKTLVVDAQEAEGLKEGDVLLFYRRRTDGGSIVASGVVDGCYQSFANETAFLRRCQKRSIFSADSLHDYWVKYDHHPVVVEFLHSYSFDNDVIDAERMREVGIDTIKLQNMHLVSITPKQFDELIKNTDYEKDIVVD